MTIDWTMQFSDVLKILGVLGSAIYVVVRVEFTTRELTNAIKNLTNVVGKLDGRVEQNERETHKIKERLAVVDTKLNHHVASKVF